jgi:uridine kinase
VTGSSLAASCVVAVAGPVGAGKSTLVAGLANVLGDTATIHFDHYERMTEQPIDAIRRWAENGADVNALPVPGLAEALTSLKDGRVVSDPATHAEISPARFILFETQFGRRHAATGRSIDFLIWIDIPPDVALARKLRQFSAGAGTGNAGQAHAFLQWHKEYLDNYLGLVGALLRRQRETVRADADLVVDGEQDAEELATQAGEKILARCG